MTTGKWVKGSWIDSNGHKDPLIYMDKQEFSSNCGETILLLLGLFPSI